MAARIAAIVFVLAIGPIAQAAPTIDVRARTRVAITEIQRSGTGVHVRGVLMDAGTGEGIVGREVVVRSDAEEQKATTTVNGRFDAVLDLPSGEHALSAQFAGDTIYGDTRFDGRRFDVGKASLRLSVDVPPEVDAASESVEVILEARSGAGPEALPLVVRVGDKSGPGTTRAVGEARTGAAGNARYVIPRDHLGLPGNKLVLVRFAGDDTFNPGEGEAGFLLYTSTQLSDLKLPVGPVRHEGHVTVSGKLLDTEGSPIPDALVLMKNTQKRLAETATDGRGRFSLRVPAAELGTGAVTFTLEYESTTVWRRGTRSGPLGVQILPPRPVPIAYTIAAFGVTAAAVAGFAIHRARPWVRVLAWLRRRRRVPASETVLRVEDGAETWAPGMKLSRPGLMSTLRRPADFGFTGRVRDVVRGTPISGARLVLTPHGGDGHSGEQHAVIVLQADADGQFETELDTGIWTVETSAHGYVTEVVVANIPHRGELRGVRMDLLPVRERVFTLYKDVAAHLLPAPELWCVWTPREILDHVKAQKPPGALGAFTAFVEETYFSARVPGEDIIPMAASSARAAAEDLRTPPPP